MIEWIIGVVAGAVAIAAVFLRGKKEGRNDVEADHAIDTQDRIERGRKAVHDGRGSGLSPDERLRRNDGRW